MLHFDSYGFPGMAVANSVLTRLEDYGESREGLQDDWETWIHHIPFDAPVAERLARLIEERLFRLDPEKDAGDFQRLERKLHLARARAARYRLVDFASGSLQTRGGERIP